MGDEGIGKNPSEVLQAGDAYRDAQERRCKGKRAVQSSPRLPARRAELCGTYPGVRECSPARPSGLGQRRGPEAVALEAVTQSDVSPFPLPR